MTDHNFVTSACSNKVCVCEHAMHIDSVTNNNHADEGNAPEAGQWLYTSVRKPVLGHVRPEKDIISGKSPQFG